MLDLEWMKNELIRRKNDKNEIMQKRTSLSPLGLGYKKLTSQLNLILPRPHSLINKLKQCDFCICVSDSDDDDNNNLKIIIIENFTHGYHICKSCYKTDKYRIPQYKYLKENRIITWNEFYDLFPNCHPLKAYYNLTTRIKSLKMKGDASMMEQWINNNNMPIYYKNNKLQFPLVSMSGENKDFKLSKICKYNNEFNEEEIYMLLATYML